MTSKIEVSREMAERIVKDGTISVAQIDQLRQKLAAPEALRQEPAGIVLPGVQFDQVTELLEANPLATNLSAQRLLRRKRPWSGS